MRPLKTLAILMIAGLLTLAISLATAQDDGSGTPDDPAQRFNLPLQGDVNYVVQPRDVLDSIGALFDVRVACIRETNGLRPADILRPGDVLLISTACPAYDGVLRVEFPREDAPGRTGADGTYTVRPNDTLDTIAQRLDISVISLARANDITNSRRLAIGTVLTIPPNAPPYGQFPALDAPSGSSGESALAAALRRAASGSQQYVVQPGDTLDTIGQRFNVSVVSLRIANEIESARQVTPGRTLVIPADAPAYGAFPSLEVPAGGVVADGEVVVLQPGDTIDRIAARFDKDTACIVRANDIRNVRAVRAGQSIGIPADCPPYSGYDFVPGRGFFSPTLVPTTVPQPTPSP